MPMSIGLSMPKTKSFVTSKTFGQCPNLKSRIEMEFDFFRGKPLKEFMCLTATPPLFFVKGKW